MLKLKIRAPEFVLGVLLTVALIALGMMYESSRGYPNNYQSHQSAEQAAKGGGPVVAPEHGEEKLTDWLLVFLNAGLVVATLILAGFVAVQIRDARRASEKQLRAFVFFKGFTATPNIDNNNRIIEYVIYTSFENVGLTPATDFRAWINIKPLPKNEDRIATFEKGRDGASTVLGPRGSGLAGPKTIKLHRAMEHWKNETEIYVWSRLEYRDIFDPRILHHHEQCAVIQLIHEPDQLPPAGHPPYMQFSVFGPQNTVG